jgi:dethiobiotin synthetase
MSGLFVTGAGTDVGKTYASCLLLAQMRARGTLLRPLKPALSGFNPAQAADSDIGRLLAAAGLPTDDATLDAHCPWRFAAPLAPNMAAAREGRLLHFADIAAWCDTARQRYSEPLLIEGAGGLMSPLTDETLNLDLARHLSLPVMMVMGSYLGAIHHGLATLSVLAQTGLRVALIVVSESEGSHVDLQETAENMQRHTPVQAPLVTLARQPLDRAMKNAEDLSRHFFESPA